MNTSTLQHLTAWNDVTFTPMGHNDTVATDVTSHHLCGNNSVPTTYWFLSHLTTKQLVLLLLYSVTTLITFIIYLDETVFIVRRFRRKKDRRQKTIWILAVFPVFSFTGLLGFMIPLAAPIVDLVANTFMATCLYNMLELMMCYLGGTEGLWDIVEEGQLSVQYATLPVCCLLPCLPNQKLDRLLLRRLCILVLQVCILRPIIMFIAAVLWANGTYNHEGLDPKTGDPYITIINSITTLIAVYGLNLVKTALIKPLKGFWLGGKVFIIQMVLATCSLSPAITKLFDKWGLVACDPVYDQRVHLDSIYRGVLVISMFLYSITARFLYRRGSDADTTVTSYVPEPEMDIKTNIRRIMRMPGEAISYLKNKNNHRRKHKSADVCNGHVSTNGDENSSFFESPKSRSSRKPSSFTRDDNQLKYIDETTSLTLEIEESDCEHAKIFGGLHMSSFNESMVSSD